MGFGFAMLSLFKLNISDMADYLFSEAIDLQCSPLSSLIGHFHILPLKLTLLYQHLGLLYLMISEQAESIKPVPTSNDSGFRMKIEEDVLLRPLRNQSPRTLLL
ncbi:uncharacterized [Tachysurus ichikawai]